MQQLMQKWRVEDDSEKDAVLDIVSDKYCRKILEYTTYNPKTAVEISRMCTIPISTVYRRLQDLQDNKMLRVSGAISEDGKKYFMYKSKIKEISSSFNGDSLQVTIVPNRLTE